MPIFKQCQVWYPKLDPRRPNARFNKNNPTWEIQLRTTDKAQKKEWEDGGLHVVKVAPDEGEPFWRVNLKKKSKKSSGEPSAPVRVVDGKLNPIDPNTIGHGSVANVRVYQYDYEKPDGGGTGLASVLMAVQLTKHIKYTPGPQDDFDEEETEVVEPEDDGEVAELPDDGDDDPNY